MLDSKRKTCRQVNLTWCSSLRENFFLSCRILKISARYDTSLVQFARVSVYKVIWFPSSKLNVLFFGLLWLIDKNDWLEHCHLFPGLSFSTLSVIGHDDMICFVPTSVNRLFPHHRA